MVRGRRFLVAAAMLGMCVSIARGQGFDLNGLARIEPGRTAAQNALWIENDPSVMFETSRRVVVADLKGSAVITMIHFAMPQELKLNRDLLLRMYWDGETSPSVDCPLVDFFCDPAGLRESVDNALVNKRRGFNAYFPMPFRQSARIELVYDGPEPPGKKLWRMMPCYSYVMYRTLDRVSEDEGYFHAHWRQEGLLLGNRDYLALDARGRGKFVGWNVTIRRPGSPGYPVDGNEKFYIDGETTPSIEFQGLEDSFGFSWGFPETESIFALTGWFPFYKGAAAYRFFLNDAIRFDKSLRVAIGFGANEDPMFHQIFSKPGNELQLSSACYWYQMEPHAPLPPMPPAADRAPAPEDRFWPGKPEPIPTPEEARREGIRLLMLCGRPEQEVVFAEPGYGASVAQGFAYDGWPAPVYHCRAGEKEVAIELKVPQGAAGTLRLYIADPDNFQGGRKQRIVAGGKDLGVFESFSDGRWVEVAFNKEETASVTIPIRAINLNPQSNAVISKVQWMEKP